MRSDRDNEEASRGSTIGDAVNGDASCSSDGVEEIRPIKPSQIKALRRSHTHGSSKDTTGDAGISMSQTGYNRSSSTGSRRLSLASVDMPAPVMIKDINNLVYASDDDSDDGSSTPFNAVGKAGGNMSTRTNELRLGVEAGSLKSEGKGTDKNRFGLPMVKVVVIAALVGIIAAASLAIGIAVIDRQIEDSPIEGGTKGTTPQQKLLEVAERVVEACSEEMLNRDMSGCQRLCRSSMCCFEDGGYSCEEDKGRDCAAYAGCEALMMGAPTDVSEKNE
ncbi:hypothetical protein ACHAW5_009431 [Stephanodiscus triporus]|uniref:Uncharacterized protein n=1 Tax=Stephanodiscus triporus TaxID=2934178 RepID=A0ABD3NWY9_9STRA